MLIELGHLSLIIAFALALLQIGITFYGVRSQQHHLLSTIRPLTILQGLFILLSYSILTYAFITHDFSLSYVAKNSNSLLPLMYRFSAVWGAHEGSLLLWVLLLSAWSVALALWSRNLPQDRFGIVLGVIAFISSGFLAFILFTSNPFDRLLPFPPQDGADLNPLLQDIGLIVHPPILYMGYVGFAIAFAFAIAALISSQFDSKWMNWCRPWTLLAFAFLSVGIALGSWWAYYELGWGGWWFWDPVENASLMPWLVGAALIHSLAVSHARGAFKSWTLLLAILAFSLSLLGTFLVRSGVLTSVHAFANDPSRGLFILGFLLLVVGGALTLYAWRAAKLHSTASFSWFSRETLLLLNNLLLVVACATILLGTLYPLILDALTGEKLSIGPPYFNTLFVPLALATIVLMALGPMSAWRHMDVKKVWLRLRYIALASLFLGIGLPLIVTKAVIPLVVVGLIAALWLILATLEDVARRSGYQWRSLLKLNSSYYGMVIAHLGVAVLAIGVCIVSHYAVERDVRLAVGEHVNIGPYQFKLEAITDIAGSNFRGAQGIIS